MNELLINFTSLSFHFEVLILPITNSWQVIVKRWWNLSGIKWIAKWWIKAKVPALFFLILASIYGQLTWKSSFCPNAAEFDCEWQIWKHLMKLFLAYLFFEIGKMPFYCTSFLKYWWKIWAYSRPSCCLHGIVFWGSQLPTSHMSQLGRPEAGVCWNNALFHLPSLF